MSNKIWYFILGSIFVGFASFSEARAQSPTDIEGVEQRMAEVGVDHESFGDVLAQASYDIKNGLVNSKAYKAINYIFYFKGFDEGSKEIMDALVDYTISGGTIKYIPGVGLIPIGGDYHLLFNRATLHGAGKLGLFALSLVPGTKLVSSAFKGLKLLTLGKQAVRLAGPSGRLLASAERTAIATEVAKLGEKELAADIARKASAKRIQQALQRASELELIKLRGWAIRVAPVALVGIGLPAYPASLSAIDIARFVLTQGCALASDSHTNPTTNALRFTGAEAIEAIKPVLSSIQQKFHDRTASEAISASFVSCDECQRRGLDAQAVKAMSDREVIERTVVVVDQNTQKLVIGSL